MKPVVGAQLYTVRECTRTAAGIEEALGRLSEIGYSTVQLSAVGPIDPAALAAIIEKSGMQVAGTHVAWGRFREDLDAVVEEHKAWGCRHAGVGGLPQEYYSERGLERFIRQIRPIAERLAAEGMDFSYHNHSRELVRYAGRTWLSRLYGEADPGDVKAEIDTYWIQAGGGDPAQWIRDCAGREPLLHLKDMALGPDGKPRFAEVGEGNLNWEAILGAAEEGGVEALLVEQDVCYDRDPFDSLAISYRNLRAMGYR